MRNTELVKSCVSCCRFCMKLFSSEIWSCHSGEHQDTVYWDVMLPQSSHSSNLKMVPSEQCYPSSKLHSITSSIFSLFFHGDGSSKFHRNVGTAVQNYTISHPAPFFYFLLWRWRQQVALKHWYCCTKLYDSLSYPAVSIFSHFTLKM
jgi:hypothetical protein